MHARVSADRSLFLQSPQTQIPVLKHPFLKALSHSQYGRLTMVTPERTQLRFVGALPGPAADITLYDWKTLDEGIARGEPGFAEGYVEGRWTTRDLATLLAFAQLNAQTLEHYFYGHPWHALLARVQSWLGGNSRPAGSRLSLPQDDLGNEFYSAWLDESMTHSGALFESDISRSLEEAQDAKHARILERLNAAPGSHVLDLGCGWGAFAALAARRNLRVTGVTASQAQADYARRRMESLGLAQKAEIRCQDFREVTGQFDHVVSIGMFEQLGQDAWADFFACVHDRLAPGGKAMVQTMTRADRFFRTPRCIGIIGKHFFPEASIPSQAEFLHYALRADLRCRDLMNFGEDYARTLKCWLARFDAARDRIKSLSFNESFIRLWRYYLAGCQASFLTRTCSVMQVELSRT